MRKAIFFKTKSLILLIGFLFMQSRCKKTEKPPEASLPPITQEGKNTMGCLINGEVYVVPIKTSKYEIQSEYYYYNFEPDLYGTFVIRSRNGKYTDKEQYISIQMDREVFDTGYYPLQFQNKASGKVRFAQYGIFDGIDGKSYICPDSGAYGWMHISRLDTIDHIASGTFEFDAVNKDDDTDTVKIRDGRFDAKFIY